MKYLNLTILLGLICSYAWAPETDANFYERLSQQHQSEVREFIHKKNIHKYDFSLQNLQLYLSLYEVPYCDYIIRQAKLETGHFSSAIFQENNNLFGMKSPKVRKTVSTGENRGHATYDHWTDSIRDYILWMDYYKERGYCMQDYLHFLDDISYAEDELYTQKLMALA